MKKDVTFKNGVWNLAGVIYLPDDFDASKKYSALVFGNPGGSVKEQTPAVYGEKLSATVKSIDDSGGLVIKNKSGIEETLRSGEVNTVRKIRSQEVKQKFMYRF